MKRKLPDEKILKYVMPTNFAVSCRRPTPGNGYLESLTETNVRVIPDGIKEILPEGIILETGEVLKVDSLICATGFNMSFCPRFTLIGRNGEDIAEKWRHKPEAYLSVAVSGFPNYFSEYIPAVSSLVSDMSGGSVSWTERSCRSWVCLAHHRTLNKVQ
jgi:cation diffusion facilitator CzcD-associated flavoprotein CzcO